MDIGRTRSQFVRTSQQCAPYKPSLPPRRRKQLLVVRSSNQEVSSPMEAVVHTVPSSFQAVAAPFASISRVFVTMQPTQIFKTLAERSALPGPAKLLVFVVALLAAVAAVTRAVLMRKVKACKCCKGYGIIRCQVCEGMGQVQWNAKFGHTTSCPLCFNKRYIACQDCGGSFPRPIFSHADSKPISSSFGGPLVANYGLGS